MKNKNNYWLIKQARGFATFDAWINAIFMGRNSSFYDHATGGIIRQCVSSAKENGFYGWYDVYKQAHTFKKKKSKK